MHRDRVLSVRFTADEYRGLQARAQAAHMSVSDYVRHAMLPSEYTFSYPRTTLTMAAPIVSNVTWQMG